MGCFNATAAHPKTMSDTEKRAEENLMRRMASTKPRAAQVKITQGVKELKQQYVINKERLGTGSYGQVYLAVDRKDPDQKVAIKVINKQKMTKEDILAIMDEV